MCFINKIVLLHPKTPFLRKSHHKIGRVNIFKPTLINMANPII